VGGTFGEVRECLLRCLGARYSNAYSNAVCGANEATGSHGLRVLVGLPHRCRPELPLLAFAVCPRRAGVDEIYLGADMPLESWPAVVRASSPRAAVISAGHSRDVAAATATTEILRSNDVPVVYVGGHATTDILGGTPLPPRLSVAADLVSSALS
jgi:MerR family transcriptional regulator, light-induced transcriptional regulator